jgi:glycosyltransferase involved in cell wall biosynthesis
MSNKAKTILMVYDQLEIGGIETLIIRASNWLLEHGYQVKLILRQKGKLFKSLDDRVQVKVYNARFEFLFTPITAAFIFNKKFFDHIEIFYTFRPEGLWIASVLAKVRRRKIKVFNCVYHPNEFFIKGEAHPETKFYSQVLLSSFPQTNLAFMNLPCKSSHESFFNTFFKEAFIFPLPVSIIQYKDIARKPRKFKLVSIGNLKAFKTYNIYMIDIVEKLIAQDYPVEYDIYGDGEMRPLMEEKIFAKGLTEHIKLKGQVQYEDLKSVLEDAYLFVGGGTAAVEAALCKVPVIIATAYSSVSYGYLYNMPGFAVGEKISGIKEYGVEYLIKHVFELNADQYEIESTRNYQYALKYNMDELMNVLVEKFESNDQLVAHSFEDISSKLYYQYYLSRILNKIKNVSSKIRNMVLNKATFRVKPQVASSNF